MNQDQLKQYAAEAALKYITHDQIVGVGTGSTVHYFIDALATMKHKIKGAVASSIDTEKKLKAHHIPVYDLNAVNAVDIYVDGADEFNAHKYLIKGAGGALTREKIIATTAKQFICIVDDSKERKILGDCAVPIEVIPMARGLVARTLVQLGGAPDYRAGITTDNGNIILDVFQLDLSDAFRMEETLNNITGAVCNGIFAKRKADVILVATQNGIREIA